ncbi:hypothetical protein ACUXCC_002291 [Cytobacillus horneckiae]|nr:hypothetical protein [Cytobacillus horneckiae]MEC1157126.1 hypothetical protein [Cytobacillus horneckiae]MED2939848.1 hypothetical protein [Cytobacillus horneckiae]
METICLIKKIIEDIWLNEIKDDYNNDFITNEDSLKNFILLSS